MKQILSLISFFFVGFFVSACGGSSESADSGKGETPVNEVDVNIANFPDPIFRQYVANNFDLDKNQKLSKNEIQQAISINVPNMGISTIKGIEYLTAVTKLDCSENVIEELDISKNTVLKDLNCSWNRLTSLDVTKNTQLEVLYCVGTGTCITSNIWKIYTLDVSNNIRLKELNCCNCGLTSLDVSKNIALTTINCSSNNINNVDELVAHLPSVGSGKLYIYDQVNPCEGNIPTMAQSNAAISKGWQMMGHYIAGNDWEIFKGTGW